MLIEIQKKVCSDDRILIRLSGHIFIKKGDEIVERCI
ncbi:hypothetical protein ES705_27145 [subsurface metagenome]